MMSFLKGVPRDLDVSSRSRQALMSLTRSSVKTKFAKSEDLNYAESL
jgi:hypothetical protein